MRAVKDRYRRGKHYSFVGPVLLAIGTDRKSVGHDAPTQEK